MTRPAHSPPAFLCGHRKSGTSLLLNLLDGHPELSAYPVDLALLYAYFPDFVTRETNAEVRRRRLRRVLFEDATQYLARRNAADRLDISAVERHFFAGLSDDDLADTGVLTARLLCAFEAAFGIAPGSRSATLAKETSAEIYATEIASWFPEAKFIHLLRDPRDNFAALAAGVAAHYGPLGEDRNATLASLLHRARLGFRFAQVNADRFGSGRYRCIRFEDLVADPRPAMEEIARFLGVGFDPCLLIPTVLGVRTGGNNYDGEAMFAPSDRNAGRWRERIGEFDACVIEFHLAEEMTAHGYAPAFTQAQQADAAAEFYKWQNYAYFFKDRFA